MTQHVRLGLRDWISILALSVSILLAMAASYLRIDRQLSELRIAQEFTLEDVRALTEDFKLMQNRLMETPRWTANR
ncbi:MAG: hypothetical protein CMJ57_09275 [Planctomycetaceae bacterium]|nr:hypothetical protein [Planctomycetaceae bacterium]|tara:strand:+ start:87 stop:314 length:228 start_codon:yes stop_codon:yes gene_type:complete